MDSTSTYKTSDERSTVTTVNSYSQSACHHYKGRSSRTSATSGTWKTSRMDPMPKLSTKLQYYSQWIQDSTSQLQGSLRRRIQTHSVWRYPHVRVAEGGRKYSSPHNMCEVNEYSTSTTHSMSVVSFRKCFGNTAVNTTLSSLSFFCLLRSCVIMFSSCLREIIWCMTYFGTTRLFLRAPLLKTLRLVILYILGRTIRIDGVQRHGRRRSTAQG